MPARTVMKWEIKETWRQIKSQGLIMMSICGIWCIFSHGFDWKKKKKKRNTVFTSAKLCEEFLANAKRLFQAPVENALSQTEIKTEPFPFSVNHSDVGPAMEFIIQIQPLWARNGVFFFTPPRTHKSLTAAFIAVIKTDGRLGFIHL